MTEALAARRRTPSRWETARLCLALLAVLGAASIAVAQTVVFELGVAGETVAGAWNPLRITLTDVPPARFALRFDEGSLRDGPTLVRYEVDVPGGGGVTVFEDDVYVPRYRSMSWTLSNAERVYASGSLGTRDVDARPLDLLLSADPGRWRTALGSDARPVDIAASQLVERPAAYDGVRLLAIDGTTAAPRIEAVAAAAAGGVRVVLLGTLPASQADLELLARPLDAPGTHEASPASGAPAARLGAGSVLTRAADVEALADAVAAPGPLDRRALVNALAAERLVRPPSPVSQSLLLAMCGVLALLLLALVRFGGAPGLLAVVVLVGIVSVASWRYLRPAAPELTATRAVLVGGGALALRIGVSEVLTLPAGTVDVTSAARAMPVLPYRVDGTGTHVKLGRWSAVNLVLRPALRPSKLRFEGASLHNLSASTLDEVYVTGLGPQVRLAAGAAFVPVPTEDGALPEDYARLVPLLPEGTAIARADQDLWLALPTTLASTAMTP